MRGQLAKLLGTIPILLAVVFLMGLFLVGAKLLAVHTSPPSASLYVVPEGSLLSEHIVFEGRNMSVLEVLFLSYFDKPSELAFMQSVRGLATASLPSTIYYDPLALTTSFSTSCVFFTIDEVSKGRDGIRYLFRRTASDRVAESITYAALEPYSSADAVPLPPWQRFRDDSNNNIRPAEPVVRVFLTREGQEFELIAYAGKCDRA